MYSEIQRTGKEKMLLEKSWIKKQQQLPLHASRINFCLEIQADSEKEIFLVSTDSLKWRLENASQFQKSPLVHYLLETHKVSMTQLEAIIFNMVDTLLATPDTVLLVAHSALGNPHASCISNLRPEKVRAWFFYSIIYIRQKVSTCWSFRSHQPFYYNCEA